MRTCGNFRWTSCIALTAALHAGCAAPSKGPSADESADVLRTWLNSIDDRYLAFDKPLTLARWKRAVGEEPGDTSVEERLEKEFYRDEVARTRLVKLSNSPNKEISDRARSWLRFIDRDRLTDDDEIRQINKQISHIAEAPFGKDGPPLVMQLFYSDDAAVRGAALAEVEARTQGALPLIRKRAIRMDAIAKTISGSDSLTYIWGADALSRLNATCRSQIERTAGDWSNLNARISRRLRRPPTLSDYAGEAVVWTTTAGTFYKPDALPGLAEKAFAQMGFDVGAMNIMVRTDAKGPGGAAFAVSIPDDIRFYGKFPPGFEGARGYFHELGHAVHMKSVRAEHLPEKRLPQDRALNEGVGEIFGLIPRQPKFVADNFPSLSQKERDEFHASIKAFDAMAIRANCSMARLEAEVHAGLDIQAHWAAIHKDTFGIDADGKPAFLIFHTPYLRTPLSTLGYVFATEVRDAFVRRLGGRPLLSVDAGTVLRNTLLAPGNALTLREYLSER